MADSLVEESIDEYFINGKTGVQFHVKGAGGSPTWGYSKSRFMLFLIEGNPSFQMLFTESKKIVLSQSYHILKFRKYKYLQYVHEL